MSIILSGCNESQRKDLVIKTEDNKRIKILWADVYQNDGQNVVYGILKQQCYYPTPIRAYVDVQVFTENGYVQYEASSKVLTVPCNTVCKHPNWVQFKVPLVYDIPKGSNVCMKVHTAKS
jgi:hypothetical protein